MRESLPTFVVIGSQIFFTGSDFLARSYMPERGLVLSTFLSGWFVAYMGLRILATFGQLYVFTAVELGKTAALFGASSIILSNLLGFLVLREVLPLGAYAGVGLAALAFVVLAVA